MAPPRDGRKKVCSNGTDHMTSMAVMLIYGKPVKNVFSGSKRLMTLKLGMHHRVLEYYQICSNNDPRLTLTYFTARSNFVPFAFVWEEGKIVDFSETIVVYDIKVGRCSHINEYMKLMSTKGQGHSLTLVQISQIQYFLNFFPQ